MEEEAAPSPTTSLAGNFAPPHTNPTRRHRLLSARKTTWIKKKMSERGVEMTRLEEQCGGFDFVGSSAGDFMGGEGGGGSAALTFLGR